MAGRKADWMILEKIVYYDPWAILIPEYLVMRYNEIAKEAITEKATQHWRRKYALGIAEESDFYTDGIGQFTRYRNERGQRNKGASRGNNPERYIKPEVVRELVIENPFLILSPSKLREAYFIRTGRRFSPTAIRGVMTVHGLEWAMNSPKWTPTLTALYRRHRESFRMARPHEDELMALIEEREKGAT